MLRLAEASSAGEKGRVSEDELHSLVERLETEIEELAAKAEGCRKWILLARGLLCAGALSLLAIATALLRPDPVAVVLSIAAILGGIVLAGSNASTLQRTLAAIGVAEAQRAQAIDAAGLSSLSGNEALPRLH